MSSNNFLKSISNYSKLAVSYIIGKIKFSVNSVKRSFRLINEGDEKIGILIWCWGMTPSAFIFLYLQNKLAFLNVYIASIFYLLILIYYIWHLLGIRRTVKKHPEYKRPKPIKETYEGMTEEEIKEAKKAKSKEKSKERIGKALLIVPWDTMETYKLMACVDAIIAITQIQKLMSTVSLY